MNRIVLTPTARKRRPAFRKQDKPIRFATYGTGHISDMMTPEAFHEFMVEWAALRNHVLGLRDKLVKLGPGKYAFGTVYQVGKTTVRAHKRRSFVAVRLRNPKPVAS